MKRETEEFLNLLLWVADRAAHPTFRNLTDSYEAWAHRTGFVRTVRRLEKCDLVERVAAKGDERVCRLTAQGRLHVLGGRDPESRWSRSWDGRWRLVLFDVPVARNSARKRLRRYLSERGFGYLQNSVWITPDPLEAEQQILSGARIDVESLLLLDARPCAGESDAEIVAGAWDFDRINRRYARLIKLLNERPVAPLQNARAVNAMLRWAAAEREAWLAAVAIDPLLPQRILPSSYLGQSAWCRRKEVLLEAARHLSTIKAGGN